MLTSAALKVGQECVFKQEQIYHVSYVLFDRMIYQC